MTGRSYSERDLTEWLEVAGRTPQPDYVDDLLARTARVRQRPAWLFPERWLPMDITVQAPAIGGRRVPFRTIVAVALVILSLVVGAVLAVGSQRRLPAPFGPAANGLVAYVAPEGSAAGLHGRDSVVPYGDIVVRDPVNGVTRTLVGGPELDGSPVFSRDGTRVAFVRDVPDGQSLYVVDVQGGEPKLVTKEPLPTVRDAAWSPDGASIAFTSVDGAMSRLWIARSDGRGASRVPLGLDLSVGIPLWRPPDGREILLVGSTVSGFLPGADYQALWGGPDEPTGTKIGLYLVRPDGTGLRAITATDGVGFDYNHTAWTSNGDRIVTQREDPAANGYLRVLVLRADGTEIKKIGPTTGVDTMAPALSPDGFRVAYADMTSSESWRLRVVPIDGAADPVESSQPFNGGAATFGWSPDGASIIVNHHFFHETWLMDARTGATSRATWTDPGFVAWQRTAH